MSLEQLISTTMSSSPRSTKEFQSIKGPPRLHQDSSLSYLIPLVGWIKLSQLISPYIQFAIFLVPNVNLLMHSRWRMDSFISGSRICLRFSPTSLSSAMQNVRESKQDANFQFDRDCLIPSLAFRSIYSWLFFASGINDIVTNVFSDHHVSRPRAIAAILTCTFWIESTNNLLRKDTSTNMLMQFNDQMISRLD